MNFKLITISLCLIGLGACATQNLSMATSEMDQLKTGYMSAGLTDADFDRDLILGTRLAGLEYCGLGNFTSGQVASLVANKKTVSRETDQITDVIRYGKNESLKIYNEYSTDLVCTESHEKILELTKAKLAENELPADSILTKAYIYSGSRLAYQYEKMPRYKNHFVGSFRKRTVDWDG